MILKAEGAKPKDGKETASEMQVKLEFLLLVQNIGWKIVGATYTD